MKEYKLTNVGSIIRTKDNVSFPLVNTNSDYQDYLKWKLEGNTPDPADAPVIVESKFKGKKPKDLTPDERNEILFGHLLDENGSIK